MKFLRPKQTKRQNILKLKFDDKNASQEQICDTIRNYYFDRDDIDNHNMPQYRFVTDENENLIPDITILKMENLKKPQSQAVYLLKTNPQD